MLLSFTDPSSTRTRFEGVTSHKTQVTHLVGGRFRLAAAGGVDCLCSSEEGAGCGNENARGGNRASGKRDCQTIMRRNNETKQFARELFLVTRIKICLLYTSPSPRDGLLSRMPSSA